MPRCAEISVGFVISNGLCASRVPAIAFSVSSGILFPFFLCNSCPDHAISLSRFSAAAAVLHFACQFQFIDWRPSLVCRFMEMCFHSVCDGPNQTKTEATSKRMQLKPFAQSSISLSLPLSLSLRNAERGARARYNNHSFIRNQDKRRRIFRRQLPLASVRYQCSGIEREGATCIFRGHAHRSSSSYPLRRLHRFN